MSNPTQIEAPCPICGSQTSTTNRTVQCVQYYYKNQPESKCWFQVWRVTAGRQISLEEIKDLITHGETKKLDNFISKAQRPFSAKLRIDRENKKISFLFENADPVPIPGQCPLCRHALVEDGRLMRCTEHNYKNKESCWFALWKLSFGATFAPQDFADLAATGRTKKTKLKNRKGEDYEAQLILDQQEQRIHPESAGKPAPPTKPEPATPPPTHPPPAAPSTTGTEPNYDTLPNNPFNHE